MLRLAFVLPASAFVPRVSSRTASLAFHRFGITSVPVLLDRPRVDAIQQQLLRRAARADMLIEHRTQHIQPARIDPPQRLARTLVARVDQPRLPIAANERAHRRRVLTPTPSSAAFAR